MMKWIVVALVVGALLSGRLGHWIKLPSHLSERLEELAQMPQPEQASPEVLPPEMATRPQPVAEAENDIEPQASTPTEPLSERLAAAGAPSHPYRELIEQGIVEPEFGQTQPITPIGTQADEPSEATPLFTENYYRLKQRLLSAIAILEGQGNDR